MRIFVLGRPGCGKSDLITAIFGVTEHDNRVRCDNGVSIHTWNFSPKTNSSVLTGDDEETATPVEIWEWSGRRIFRGIQSFFFTRSSLFLLCVSTSDSEAADDFIETWLDIHSKVSSPNIIVVCTHNEGTNTPESSIHNTKSQLKRCIIKVKEKYSISNTNRVSALHDSLTEVENSLESDTPSDFILHVVDLPLKKEIHKLKVEIFRRVEFQLHKNSILLKQYASVIKTIKEMKSSRNILMKQGDFEENIGISPENEDLFDALESKNIILRLFTVNKEPTICTDPRALVQILISVHVLDQTKVYQIDSQKFWGADITKRPDPGILVRVLEDVAKQGILRENLLPLLWQNITEDEDEIRHWIELLGQTGIISRCNALRTKDSKLVLYTFPHLQSNRTYYVTPADLIPNKSPTISWTTLPVTDDIEVSVMFTFPSHLPSGYKHLVIGGCRNINQDEALYSWMWSDGVLMQFPKITTCMNFTANKLYVSGRTNVLEYESRPEAISAIWGVLSYPLTAVENIRRNWGNIELDVRSIRIIDNSNPSPSPGEQGVYIPIDEVFITSSEKRQQYVPLQDLPSDCDYFGFLQHLTTRYKKFKSGTVSSFRKHQDGKTVLKSDWRRKCRTKGRRITWILTSHPQSKKMASVENISGIKKEPPNQRRTSQVTFKDQKDTSAFMELVNGFVEEILRKGLAKYREDMSTQTEVGGKEVKWSITAVTSIHATNMETSRVNSGVEKKRNSANDNSCVPSSKFCGIL
ncbi:uncharacterized protein LOC133194210 [Saccostrea echinata]|uniref:uncharacterized protein LOC133194210 n=1 Tax=Saccostrea echinata TaxID=191078 RepID=UPI002A83890E|nr:uncharacterized protein LOC133194210 [Saccostrea echinata]